MAKLAAIKKNSKPKGKVSALSKTVKTAKTAERRPTVRQKQKKSSLNKQTSKPKAKKVNIEQLILDHRDNGRRLSRSLLRKWNVNIEPDEIDSIVDYALCDAASRFRTDKGASFMTFFYYHLRGHLVRLIAEASSNTSLFVSSATSSGVDLGDYSSCAPTLNTNSYCDLITTRQKISESPEELLLKKEELVNCRSQVDQLDKLEQTIVARLYATDEPLNKIARSLGYSRCHISRVKKTALRKLKHLFENSPLYFQKDDANKQGNLIILKTRKRTRRKLSFPQAALELRKSA